MNQSALFAPALLALVAAGLPVAACSSNQNHAERDKAPEALTKPDYWNMTQAQLKQQCIGPEVGRPSIDGQPPACTPDPGSRPVSQVGAQTGYTFAWLWELKDASSQARATYTYDDNTALFVVPERDSRANSAVRPPGVADVATSGWQPYADPIAPVPGINFGFAVRFRGGPFQEYGGGFGQSFRTITNPDDMSKVDENGQYIKLPSSPEFSSDRNGAYDLRTYHGIAIWVRRGPLGMSTMRVGLTEKNSAEDLNSGAIKEIAGPPLDGVDQAPGIVEGKHCRRWRLCGCAGGTPCSVVDPTKPNLEYRCFDPALGEDPLKGISCGPSRCTEANTSTNAIDPLFTRAVPDSLPVGVCTQFQTSDGRTDNFCYDPAIHPEPPAKRERCNNPFSRPITVTMDWQLIKVPFTELLQADEGNVADEFDLASVKQIVVTHGGGWTDFWVANVGFYKKL